jgi:hypothetical protein
MVFNAASNNISVISWRSVLLVKETRVPGENHLPVTSHWQTLGCQGNLKDFSYLVPCLQYSQKKGRKKKRTVNYGLWFYSYQTFNIVAL